MTDNITERATDPRLEQTPVTEPVVDQVIEPVVDSDEPVDEVVAPVVEEPPKPPKKTAEEVLKGRVGHLTKTLSNKDQAIAAKEQELADFKSRLAAAEALLNSSGQQITPPVTTSTPNTIGQTYNQADFEAAVAAQAEAQEFNRRADEMYSQGATKFPDWKDSVETLVAAGFMNKDLLDAAMAIEDGPVVLHHLGSNLDEAERISALSPIRKAAEMAKLSNVLKVPVQTPVSSAPTPIRPVSGSPSPQVDLQRVADTDDMRAYVAARAKTGARWAQPGGMR
jgi:hypothetical protein